MNPAITRHVLTLPGSGRKVHYRRCGSGPVLLMVHQSPRSSAEYADLMRQWGSHFTCIAPDTPGFGQSDPLPGEPDIADFADALCAFLDALGVKHCAAYGFHSGGIILVTAIKRQPQRFSCLAIGGYAIWTEAEMRLFGERYLPEFHPSPYGEHLTWLWNRMLEQSWVFPWFDTREEARLSVAHADIPRVAQAVSEMLDAGNAYQAGYGAVLRAPRDIPPPEATPKDGSWPPCLITAYDRDPLQDHIDRLGDMPAAWSARKVATPAEHQSESLAFLKKQAGDIPCPDLAEDAHEGWVVVNGSPIHWKGTRGAARLVLHGPAREMSEPGADEVAIDVPGHGQSGDCEDIALTLHHAKEQLGATELAVPDAPTGDPDRLYPDMTPDRFGQYLQRAWQIARAEAFFKPWYEANAAHAIPLDPARLDPHALNVRALARIRAGDAARRWHETLITMKDQS